MVARLNIVVVEDNDELREAMVGALQAEGHGVTGLDCAEAVPEQVARARVDLMIVDLNLPGEDGVSLAQRVRRLQPRIGIVMVTARALPSQRQEGYAKGADIYMTKPVTLAELISAIDALARRLDPVEAAPDALELDQARLTLRGPAASPVSLTPSEAALMAAFGLALNQRLEKWQIIEALQRDDADDPVGALELVIVRLRKKIRRAGVTDDAIRVIRNWGYQLCVPVRSVSSGSGS